ncbi:MAG: hypothetical protein KDC53_11850 [Saprospiraceae bacterium]|nr:hypothetical protein [Saprospiraceae bacterium]
MMLAGYTIGPIVIYRLMQENGLLGRRNRPGGKTKVRRRRRRRRRRRVNPSRPLEVIAMDIKQVWIEEFSRSTYIS